MCQFSACHPGDESGHGLFQQLDPKAAAAVQGGWWAYHLDNAHHGHHAQLVSAPYHSSGHGYGGPTPSFSSPPHISPVEESVSTYGYSYGYGTNF